MKYVATLVVTLALTLGITSLFSHNTPESGIVKVLNFEHTGGGTGFSAKRFGRNVVVTNAHVCSLARNGEVVIREETGKESIKTVIKTIPDHDLCIIQGVQSPALTIAKNGPQRFEQIAAMGHPFLNPLTRSPAHTVNTWLMESFNSVCQQRLMALALPVRKWKPSSEHSVC